MQLCTEKRLMNNTSLCLALTLNCVPLFCPVHASTRGSVSPSQAGTASVECAKRRCAPWGEEDLTCARHLAQVWQLLGSRSSQKEQLDFQSTTKFHSHRGPTLTLGEGLSCSKKTMVQGPSQLILVVSQIQLLRKRFGLENITHGNVVLVLCHHCLHSIQPLSHHAQG